MLTAMFYKPVICVLQTAINLTISTYSCNYITVLAWRRLKTFVLSVGNSRNRLTPCANHNHDVASSKSVTKSCQAVGRYLRFSRDGGPEPHSAGLCEVVIIGHLFIDKRNSYDRFTHLIHKHLIHATTTTFLEETFKFFVWPIIYLSVHSFKNNCVGLALMTITILMHSLYKTVSIRHLFLHY